jgi:hypothetical protein
VTAVRSPRRPVARLRVLAGFALALALLVGLGAATELLRHPPPDGGPIAPPDDGDVRDEVVCPDPPPREGVDRDEPDLAGVPEVSSGDLLDCPQTFDGAIVRYSGEVVGAVLRRRDGAWLQLNDDVYAEALGPLPAHRDYRGGNAGIGVFVERDLADDIAFVGGPAAQGDIVGVVGVYHRVDAVSGEVAVIRPITAEISLPGRPFEHAPLRDRRLVALLLAPIAGGLVLLERVLAGRR